MESWSFSCPTRAPGLRCMACASFPCWNFAVLILQNIRLGRRSFLAALSSLVEVNRAISVARISKCSVGAIAAEEGAAAVRVWASISLPGFLPLTVQSHFQPQALHLLTRKAASPAAEWMSEPTLSTTLSSDYREGRKQQRWCEPGSLQLWRFKRRQEENCLQKSPSAWKMLEIPA